jgi:hypothetical protein
MPIHRHMFAVLVVVCGLTLPTLGQAQDTSLIYACVDARGSLRIVAPETACSPKETRLTWPAEPSTPTTFYQRVSAPSPIVEGITTAIALCDAPEDVVTGGGFRSDGVTITDGAYTVLTSAPCAATGLCGGTRGEDGWGVAAKSASIGHPDMLLRAYVICATAAP